MVGVCHQPLYGCSRCGERFDLGMARRRTQEESDDHIARSVLDSPGVTEDRTRQEHRVGSGNRRGREGRVIREPGVVSNSKTGPDRRRSDGSNRRRAKKPPARH